MPESFVIDIILAVGANLRIRRERGEILVEQSRVPVLRISLEEAWELSEALDAPATMVVPNQDGQSPR